MKKIIVLLIIGLMITGCGRAFRDTKDYDVEDLKTLIGRVYEGLEFGSDTYERILDNEQIIEWTGITDTADIEIAVTSDAISLTTPYSFALLKVNNRSDIKRIKEEIQKNVNLERFGSLSADVAYITNYGYIIILINSDQESADLVYQELTRATNKRLGEKLIRTNE